MPSKEQREEFYEAFDGRVSSMTVTANLGQELLEMRRLQPNIGFRVCRRTTFKLIDSDSIEGLVQ